MDAQELIAFGPGELRLPAFDVNRGKAVDFIFADHKWIRIARLSGFQSLDLLKVLSYSAWG